MAILVSPSNNSGWGLGLRSMYGGARRLSPDHPVLVRRHYRANWGSLKGRVPRTTMATTDDPVADVVNAIAGATRRRRRHRRRRRAVRVSSVAVTGDPVADVVNAVEAVARRRRARRRSSRMQTTGDPVADVVAAVEAVARRRRSTRRRRRRSAPAILGVRRSRRLRRRTSS